MKKLLFPFYKERHKFLVQKWWFRVILLAYFIWLPISPFYLGLSYLHDQTDWCYDTLDLFDDWGVPGNKEVWESQLDRCTEIARENWVPAIGVGIIGAPILNFLLQFLFFKILMDFIVLGTRFKRQGG